MKVKHGATAVERNPALASIPRSQDADTLVTEAGRVGTQTSTIPCRFEVNGSLLFLQPVPAMSNMGHW
jgi:hypothetical protein